jgi:replicative DNA helicase
MDKKTSPTRKRTKPNILNQNELGKLPPQAIELEEAILGALMLEKLAPEKVVDVLKKDSFYHPPHKLIYEAIVELFENNHPVDILTVADKLRKSGNLEMVGGAFYVTQLTNKVTSAANIEYHSHILTQKFIQRELIRVAGEMATKGYDETADAFELLDEAEKNLFAIKNETMKKNYDDIKSLLGKAIFDIENLKGNEDGLTGVPTGFTDLDRLTGGWQKSDLIILAARPGMGKTAFVLSMARNAAVLANKSVALFSLEMSSLQLTKRLISAEAELQSDKLRMGNLEAHEWEQLHAKINALENAQIYIDDTPALSILDLKAKARRLKSQRNIDMIIIDYLQLMRGDEGSDKRVGGNREQEISYISRSLKGLAKELEIPVIALAQLSRAVEQRTDKRPLLSDLRESGSIEQDADLVTFIYRPAYYQITEGEDGEDITNQTEIIVRKNRHGNADTIKLRFIGQFGKFMDWDDYGDSGMVTVPSKMNEDIIVPPSSDEDIF